MSEALASRLEDLSSDITRLSDLIEIVVGDLVELDRKKLESDSIAQLNRTTSLAWIGRDLIDKLKVDLQRAMETA